LGDKKLSERAATIFQAAERGETRLILPAIVSAFNYFDIRKLIDWRKDENTPCIFAKRALLSERHKSERA